METPQFGDCCGLHHCRKMRVPACSSKPPLPRLRTGDTLSPLHLSKRLSICHYFPNSFFPQTFLGITVVYT